MPIQKNRFARSLAIKVIIGLSRCIGLSRRTAVQALQSLAHNASNGASNASS
jgi:hypothetical protein